MPAMAVMASRFTPAPPTSIANCEAYYNADVGTTIATGVSQWNDQSGNSNTLTQGTAAQQPAFVSSWRNGKAAIQFDGGDDSLWRATLSSGTIAQPTTMLLVFESANESVKAMVDSRDASNRQLLANDSGWIGSYAGAYIQNARTWASTESCIQTAVFNGASSSNRVLRHGLSTLTGSGTAGSGSINGLTIGNAFSDGAGTAGKIASFSLYRRTLNASEILMLETWGKAYYAITTA